MHAHEIAQHEEGDHSACSVHYVMSINLYFNYMILKYLIKIILIFINVSNDTSKVFIR